LVAKVRKRNELTLYWHCFFGAVATSETHYEPYELLLFVQSFFVANDATYSLLV
jgi:hypothetical protein